MKKSRRIWLWLSILVVLPSLLAFGPPPAQNENITIDIDFGYDTFYRANEWTPLRVTVQSDESIDGFLRVSVPNDFETTDSVYQVPIQLDRRSGSATLFLHIVPTDFSNTFTVEVIRRSDGRILATESVHSVNLHKLAVRDMLYVVVTESITDTINMTTMPIGRGEAEQANLNISEIPDTAVALESIDVLVFFDVDTGNLSVPQRTAIRNWVLGGGHLIVHSGQNWNRTLAGLGDIVPVAVTSTTTLDDMSNLGLYLDLPDDILRESSASLANSTPFAGTEILVEVEGGVPLVVRAKQGAGLVDFIAFDPLTEPFSTYAGLPNLWFELTATTRLQPSWQGGLVNWSAAERAVRIESNFEFPPVIHLLGFLAIYVVLIGPLNYLILSRLKRPEFAWFTIPILIVSFTTVAYFAGFNLRGNAPSVNHINVVQVWADSNVARVDSAVGIFSPRRTTYDVEIGDQILLRPLPKSDNGSVFGTNIAESNLTITEGNTYRANDIPVDAGIITTFTAEGYTKAADYDSQATWYLSNTSENLRITGSFISELDLADAVLLVKDGGIQLGDIPANERVEFDAIVDLQEPTWNSFGNQTTYNSPFYFNGRNGRSIANYNYGYNYSYSYSYNYGYDCPSVDQWNTKSKIMQRFSSDCDYSDGYDDLDLQSRQLLLEAVINDIDFSGGLGTDMYVVGWTDTAPFNVSLPEHSADINHKSLYIFQVPAEFQGQAVGTSRVMIPPGLMTWTVAGRDSQNTRRDVSPYSLQLNSVEQSVLRFTPFAELHDVNVDTVQINLQISGSVQIVAVEVYNWTTGEWDVQEVINGPNDILFRDEAIPNYLGPNNAVEIRIRPTVDAENSSSGFSGSYVDVSMLEVYMFGTLE